jgi:hypothetical protein
LRCQRYTDSPIARDTPLSVGIPLPPVFNVAPPFAPESTTPPAQIEGEHRLDGWLIETIPGGCYELAAEDSITLAMRLTDSDWKTIGCPDQWQIEGDLERFKGLDVHGVREAWLVCMGFDLSIWECMTRADIPHNLQVARRHFDEETVAEKPLGNGLAMFEKVVTRKLTYAPGCLTIPSLS